MFTAMDLYTKAGPDGSVGDCPFSHTVRMVLAVKGLQCTVHPCAPDQKPAWLVQDLGGKMPCLDDKGERTVCAPHTCKAQVAFTTENLWREGWGKPTLSGRGGSKGVTF